MKFKDWLINFVVVFVITFVVTAVITFLWNYFFHKTCGVNWETASMFAIIFGIILPTMDSLKK